MRSNKFVPTEKRTSLEEDEGVFLHLVTLLNRSPSWKYESEVEGNELAVDFKTVSNSRPTAPNMN